MAEKDQALLNLIKSYATGLVKGNTVDTLGAPVDLVNELIVRPIATMLGKGDKVSDKPVGGSKYIRELVGQSAEDKNPAETAGSMISAAGAAKTAIILPAFLMKSLGDVKTAARAYDARIDSAKVEEATGIFRLPDNINDGVLRSVLHPGLAEFNPRQLNFYQDNIIKPAQLDEVISFPELFSRMPELSSYRIVPEPGLPLNNAYHNPVTRTIGLGNAASKEELMKSILHEMQHSVQDKYGMNTGSNPTKFYENVTRADLAQNALAAKAKSGDKTAAGQWGILEDARYEAVRQYKKVAGESEARAVEKMRDTSGKITQPLTYYGDEYDLNRMIQSPDQVSKVDSDPVIRKIIEDALASAKSSK